MRRGPPGTCALLLLLPTLAAAFRIRDGQSGDRGLVPAEEATANRQPAGGGLNFTVLVNTFRRPDCLAQVLRHWLSCSPAEVRVTWSEGVDVVPAWLLEMERGGRVVVDRYESNRLTNRFRPQRFRSEAVFTVDDDIYYGCEALIGAFRAFQRDPRRIVGFAARVLGPSGYAYSDAFKTHRANTLFVTKGAFLPSSLLTSYFSAEYEKHRSVVDKHTTAEDMLMSFVYARTVGLPVVPLLVEQRQVHKLWPCGGLLGRQLMTRPGSNEVRRSLLESLFEDFGDALARSETETFLNAETARAVDMETAAFVEATGGHKAMRHEGKDFLMI